MPTSTVEIDIQIIEELLLLPTLEEKVEYLSSRNLFHEEGLIQLLTFAMNMMARSNPAQVRELTIVCANIAEQAKAPSVIPRALYIQAQTYAIKGELATSLELIKAAHDGYLALGQELQALRTDVGLMHVLNDMGRYQEALTVSQSAIERLDRKNGHQEQFDGPEAELVIAFIHNNRGVCYRRMGRYEDALSAYAAAEAHYLVSNMPERMGDIQTNRGIILLHLGRVSEALAAFEAGAKIHADANLTLLHTQSLINIGEAHLLLGNYSRSLDTLAQAQQQLDSLDALTNKNFVLLHRADVYLALNLYPEALDAYREADRQFQSAGMTHYRARSLWGMGSALIAQFQFEEAELVLAEAAALFTAIDNVPMLCSVMLEQAALQAARGERELAIATARTAHDLVAGNDWPVQYLYAHLRLADLLLPDAAAAESHLLAAQTLSEKLVLPHLRYRLGQRLGHLRRLQGRDEEAEGLLTTAVQEIERLRGTVAQEAMRASFSYDKTAVYEELLQLYLGRDNEKSRQQAFAVAEQAKSRALVDLLTGVIETKQALPADPNLAARLKTLQADLNAIYNEFLGSTREREQAVDQLELHGRAKKLEQEINQLRLLSTLNLDTSDLFTAALPFDTIQKQLPTDLIMLAYHTMGDEIMAFIHVGGQIHAVRQVSTVTAVQGLLQRLVVQWDRFRAGQAFAQRHMALLEQSAQRVLGGLYNELIAPLKSVLAEASQPVANGTVQKLAIVPHGLLHQTPFHALFDGRDYLLEHYEISYAPSATVLALCQERDQRPLPAHKALIMGVSDPLIPAAATEAQTVAHHLQGADVYLDDKATLATLQAEAANYSVLHLACHGLFRSDNPMFSALKLHDGWLTAADVLDLDLTGALVALSACESGRSQVLVGDEVMGLARAFLGAGATTLVVSLWLVQDDTTMTLMADWYSRLQQKTGLAAALRASQLALKADYPHPYYWAPFVLLGRR